MRDIAEYDRLQSDRRYAEDQLADAIKVRDEIQDKIDRLKIAKGSLSNCYNSFSSVERETGNTVRKDYSWQGSKYDEFSSMGDSLVSANKIFGMNLDDARDEINMEIARLENKIFEQEGLLGKLRSWINSLVHQIENFFND